MSHLPAGIEAGLKKAPAGLPLHLVTRHSIREEATSGFADYSLPLTEEGRVLARLWGRRLDRSLNAVYSSPVERCLDTANEIKLGAGINVPTQQEACLVEPGCYVIDIQQAGREFLQVGVLDFINLHLKERNAAGVLSPLDGQRKLLRYLMARQPPSGQLAAHVTHDTILAAFIAGLRGCNHIGHADWPAMLEGVWLWFDGKRVHWVWRNQMGSSPLPAGVSV